MEQSLTVWIEDMTQKRLPLDGNIIQQKALKIFNYLKETGQSTTDEDNHQFVASKGWFEKFKKRHALHNLKIQGETASADADAANKYPEQFIKIIEEHGYLPDQIFNADETDNAPAHATDLSHPNIQVEFLPPNTTSILQPLDQGIISTFKACYIRKSFELILEKIESLNITVKEVWKQFSILDCCEIVSKSLKDIRQSTLRACWKALLLEVVVQETVVNLVEDEYENVVRLANVIKGDGFDEINVADIRELVVDDELNEVDLAAMTSEALSIEESSDDLSDTEIKNFSLKSVEKLLNLAKELEEYVLENDPLNSRAEMFKRNLEHDLSAYQEIYKDLRSRTKQTSIKDFLRPAIIAEPDQCDSGSSSDFEIGRPRAKRLKQIIISEDEEADL
ncbi:tigger transposable element-derived protein 1-like [Anastrepha ludens]|uniref:tigger transposable element-derived protein 1-like n=1 Tax=Anastrepha ludens TaxID=28586 RepID=UPI0023AEF5E9|nr:tigger transposable element-derived protein 1-like [Anastrepha ludens]